MDDDDDAAAMAQFWSWGYERALESLEALAKGGRTTVVISHADLTAAGTPGQNLLRAGARDWIPWGRR